jgi:hypothetical protein
MSGNVRRSAVQEQQIKGNVNTGRFAEEQSALGAVGMREPSAADFGAFFAGFMLSSVVWAVVFAGSSTAYSVGSAFGTRE